MTQSEQRYKWLISLLNECSSIGEAAARSGMTKVALKSAFSRRNDAPSRHLKAWGPPASTSTPVQVKPPLPVDIPIHWEPEVHDTERPPPPPPLDPVQRRDARVDADRTRREMDDLVRQLKEARARQAFIDNLATFRAPPKIIPRESSTDVREFTAVVLASDWHVEEPVEPAGVAYRNEYNLEIAAKRIERFFKAIIWNIEHHRASGRVAIRDLVLWLGGDLMTGYIHPELVESNLLSPTETIRWLLPHLRNGFATLLSRLDFAHIEVPCSFGNHGRTTEKRRIATGYANSFEWLMYHSLADEFRNEPRIHFEITPSAHQYVEVYGRTIHFHHGDDVRFMGGVGGLGIPLLKAVPMWDRIKRADIHCIGHHHTLKDFGRAVVNGSLIGYGTYSQSIRADFEEPQQAMFYMDKTRGKCMLTPLWVEDDATSAAHAAGR